MSMKESRIPTGEKVFVFSLDSPTQLDLCVVVLRSRRESMCKKKKSESWCCFFARKRKQKRVGGAAFVGPVSKTNGTFRCSRASKRVARA